MKTDQFSNFQERQHDLSPFVTHGFGCGEKKLNMLKTLKLMPELDESQQYLCLRDDRLGIDVFAMDRKKLHDELLEQLSVLWKEYALEPDDALSSDALALKNHLNSAIFNKG